MGSEGILIINTGNGKGKTTAAFGQALRAAGHGHKVAIIQFIKANDRTGEAKAIAAACADNIELHVKGSGFTWLEKDQQKVAETARRAWDFAKDRIESDSYDLIVLDELTYLIKYGFLSEDELLQTIAHRPGRLTIVITGRDASRKLMDSADLVTEMKEIKHHYNEGKKARRGIEF